MASSTLKGRYQCPLCHSTEVVESQVTKGAIAYTLNTPGPVDPTLISPLTDVVYHCTNCGEKAKWIPNPAYISAKMKKEAKVMPWVTTPFALVFAGLGIYVLNDPWIGSTATGIGIAIFSFLMSGVMGLAALASISTAKKR